MLKHSDDFRMCICDAFCSLKLRAQILGGFKPNERILSDISFVSGIPATRSNATENVKIVTGSVGCSHLVRYRRLQICITSLRKPFCLSF